MCTVGVSMLVSLKSVLIECADAQQCTQDASKNIHKALDTERRHADTDAVRS